MRFSSRTWSIISLGFLVAGALFLWLDSRREPRGVPENGQPSRDTNAATSSAASLFPLVSLRPASAAPGMAATPVPASMSPGAAADPSAVRDRRRLSNTLAGIDQLLRMESAILLENAWIDTALGAELPIPPEWRSDAEPGSYVVQSVHPIDRGFYELLQAAGASFVAYVPNNAVLIQATRETAQRLEASGEIRAVLPFEPYYKLSTSALGIALGDREPPEDPMFRVTFFPGTGEEGRGVLGNLGAEELDQNETPFGPQVIVRAPAALLVSMAQSDPVQRIEVAHPRALMNDLSRERVGVAPDPTSTNQYLDLTGAGVLVNINDTGVDAEHPALVNRVRSSGTNIFFLEDPNGHGTHVAGTIAGSGEQSETVTNANASFTNSFFAGMAPEAELFVLPVDLQTGPLVSDSFLQQEAAREYYERSGGTNLLVSNNSWAYVSAFDYDMAAAAYDAAVRDALPDVPGMQPILYVFAAGNSGNGRGNGFGGDADSIPSPGTAKNVITVGAIEQPRLIDDVYYVLVRSNEVDEVVYEIPADTNGIINIITNFPYLEFTDTPNEVAAFSSRGNTGLGREGTTGRFKPDVVAPGTFLISTRSAAWKLEEQMDTDSPLYPILSNLNVQLGPHYRYETGTSMSAPVVTGLLALMQEFFEQRLQRRYSPALLKALLIHGSRSVNPNYDLQVDKALNYQGWGLPDIANILPEAVTNVTDEASWPFRFFDDSSTNLLSTGDRQTWRIQVTNDSRFLPMRFTLVWTDPPGNPGVSVKLVNDLDLIVTNLDTGQRYVGNDIERASDFNRALDTNDTPVFDAVNNVERINLQPEGGTNFTVTVIGRRVNVNAVTADNTDVVQDYALVFSAGDNAVTNAFELVEYLGPTNSRPAPSVLTNGVAAVKQRAGANYQLIEPNGVTNQWRFYLFTNTFYTNQNVSGLTNGSNVAFVTFVPPNLSRPRNFEADIDLYVSTNRELLDLEPPAVAGAFKSLRRTGTETLVFTNASTNTVFYVGVKAEDQQAAEFGLIVLSTDLPFSEEDEFGNQVLRGLPLPTLVPDGSPDSPGGVQVFAIPTSPVDIIRVVADVTFRHESVGDLVGILSHEGEFVALHNHNRFDGSANTNWSLTYDDAGGSQFVNSRPSDGPGSLLDFIGQASEGAWLFTVTDNAFGRTGTVDSLSVRLTPNPLVPGTFISGTVAANEWDYYLVDVPVGASALEVELRTASLPLDLYLRREELPTFDDYDKFARISPPGGILRLTIDDVPPLNPGRYFIGIFNPNGVPVDYMLRYIIETDPNAINAGLATSPDTPLQLPDDARVRSTIFVPEDRPIVDMQVGVRVNHPRASDLVFHLLAPDGTRILLAENRGGSSPDGYGATLFSTNSASVSSQGGPDEDRQVLALAENFGTLRIQYQFYSFPDTLRVYYDNVLLYDSGFVSGTNDLSINFGPGLSTNITIVVNEGGNPRQTTAWNYNAFVSTERDLFTVFTERTNLTTVPIKFAQPPFTNSPSATLGNNRLVFDEDFEAYPTGRVAGASALGFWTVGPGDILIHGPGNALAVPAFSGSKFLELSVSNAPSGIATEFSSIVGANYFTSFYIRRNPAGPPGSPQLLGVYVDGVLQYIANAELGEWIPFSVAWEGMVTQTSFAIRSLSSVAPLVDKLSVLQALEGGEAYFLPEENLLRSLTTSSSFGNWTLEVTDNRVGGLATTPELKAWYLSFVFARTNPPAIRLVPCAPGTNTVSVYADGCTPATNVVAGGEIKYYIVEVPRAATAATNLALSLPGLFGGSGDLVLLYNPDGLPTGNSVNDVVVDTPNPNGEILLLNTNLPPLLRPGQRYYLGVANVNTNETNAFFVQVAFDRVDTNQVMVTPLTSGVPVTNGLPVTNLVHYYQLDVTTNATHVLFELLSTNGNADLIVRKAQPIPDPLPRPQVGLFDYDSRRGSNAVDEIMVTRGSQFVPLSAGLWYVGVFNNGTTPVDYELTATEFTNLVHLVNNTPVSQVMSATNGFLYFSYQVSPFATDARFSLLPLDGDLNLYLRKAVPTANPLPQPPFGLFDYFSANPGTNEDWVLVDAVSLPTPLEAGYWFIAVENPGPTPVSFQVQVNENLSIPTNIIPLTNGVPVTLTFAAGAPIDTYFQFDITGSEPSVLFEAYDLSAPADLFVQGGILPSPQDFLASDSGSSLDTAQVVLRTGPLLPVLNGNWFLLVQPQGPGDLTFTVRAALPVGGILVGGQPASLGVQVTAGPGGSVQFTWNCVSGEKYRIERSSDLLNWAEVATVTATGETCTYTDTSGASLPAAFYRLVQVP